MIMTLFAMHSSSTPLLESCSITPNMLPAEISSHFRTYSPKSVLYWPKLAMVLIKISINATKKEIPATKEANKPKITKSIPKILTKASKNSPS